MLDTLTTLLQPWSDYFSESAYLPTMTVALHVLALFVGGGTALAADRRVLLATPGTPEAYRATADELRTTHALVIGALVITVLSGVALATSDVGTFWGSQVFWAKMAMFGLLITNGLFMRRTESRVLEAATTVGVIVDQSTPGSSLQVPLARLKRSAAVSLVSWCAIVVLGVVLSDI
jgi:hypothetical protein